MENVLTSYGGKKTMIRRYVYGNVIETEAVLNKPEQENGVLPYFTVDEQAMTLSYTMEDKDQVYGLGENVRGINKRGWYYESKCSDDKIILLKAQKSFSHLGYTPCSVRSFLHFIHSPVRHFRPAAPDSREKSKT